MKIKTKLQLSRISALATVCIFFASCLENEAEAENQAAEAAVPKPRVIELGDDVDEEQMRITKLIRERILKQVEKDAGKEAEAYTEELDTGASFEMLPVKGGGFRWQGEQADDVIDVTLTPFWMGKHEVTWDEYEPFMITELPREKDGQVVDFMRDTIEDDGKLLARPTPPYHPMTYGMPR